MADEIVGDLKVNIGADARNAVRAFGEMTDLIGKWAERITQTTGTLVKFTGITEDSEKSIMSLAESINNNVNVQFERLSEVVSEAAEKSIIALGRFGTASKNTATQVSGAMQDIALATEESANAVVKASEESIKAWQYRTKQITSDAYLEYLDAEIAKLSELEEVTVEYMRVYETMRRVQGDVKTAPMPYAKQAQADFIAGEMNAREYESALTEILDGTNGMVEKNSVEYGQILAQRERVTKGLLKQEAADWEAFVALYKNSTEQTEFIAKADVAARAVLQQQILDDEKAALAQEVKAQLEANSIKKAQYDAGIVDLEAYVNQTREAFDAISTNTERSTQDYVRALQERTRANALLNKQNNVNRTKPDTGTEHWAVSGWTQIMSGMMVLQPMFQATEAAANFQEKLTKLSATAGESASSLPQLSKNILKVSTDFGIVADKVADAQFVISSLGLRGAQGLTALTNAAKLSRGAQVDMEDSSKLLARTMVNYGQSVQDGSKDVDIYTRAITLSLVQGKEFVPALANLQLVAHNAGLSVAETASALDVMTQHTKSASIGSTYLRNLLQGIVKPTSDMSKAFQAASDSMKAQGDTVDAYRLKMIAAGNGVKLMRDEHLSFGEVLGSILRATKGHIELLDTLFPDLRKNQGAMALLNDGLKDYNKTLALNNDSQGANAAALKNQKQDAEDLATAWNNLSIALGTVLIPMMEDLTKSVKQVTSAFIALPDWEQQLIVKSAALAAGFVVLSGVSRVFVGSIIETAGWVKSLGGGVETLATKLGLVAPATGEVAEGTLAAGGAIEGATVATTSALGPIALLVGAIIGLAAAWTTNYGKIRDSMAPFAKDVEDSFGQAGKAIKTFSQSVLPELKDAVKKLEPFFTEVFKYIGDYLVYWFNNLKARIAVAWTAISGIFKIALDVITLHWNYVWSDLKSTASNELSAIVNAIDAAIPGTKSAMDRLGDAIQSSWNKHMSGFVSGLNQGFNSGWSSLFGDDDEDNDGQPDLSKDPMTGTYTGTNPPKSHGTGHSAHTTNHAPKHAPTPLTADQIEAAKEAAEEDKLNTLFGGGDPSDFRTGLGKSKVKIPSDPTAFIKHINDSMDSSNRKTAAQADPNAGPAGVNNYDARIKEQQDALNKSNAGITTQIDLYRRLEESQNTIKATEQEQLVTEQAIHNVIEAKRSTTSKIVALEEALKNTSTATAAGAERARVIREQLQVLVTQENAQASFLQSTYDAQRTNLDKIKTLKQTILSIDLEIKASNDRIASDEVTSYQRQMSLLQAKDDYQTQLLNSYYTLQDDLASNATTAASHNPEGSTAYEEELNRLNKQSEAFKVQRDLNIENAHSIDVAKDAFAGLSDALDTTKQQYEDGSLSLKDYVANLELARTTALKASKYYSGISGGDDLSNQSAKTAADLGQQEVEAINEANAKALEASKKAGESLAEGFTSAFAQAIKKSKSLTQALTDMLKDEAEKQLEGVMKNSIETIYKRAFPAKQTAVPKGIDAPEIKFSSAVDTFWQAVQAFTGRSGAVPGGTGTPTGLTLGGSTALNVAGQFGVAGAKAALSSIIPSADALGATLGSGSKASTVQRADAISSTTLSAISQVVKPTNSAAGSVVGALQSTVALGSTIEKAAKVTGGFSQALGAAAPWLGLVGSAISLFSLFGSHKETASTSAKPQIEAALRSFKTTKSDYTGQEGLRNLLGATTMQAAGMRAEGANGAPPIIVNIHPGAIQANGVQDANEFSKTVLSRIASEVSWSQQATGLRRVS